MFMKYRENSKVYVPVRNLRISGKVWIHYYINGKHNPVGLFDISEDLGGAIIVLGSNKNDIPKLKFQYYIPKENEMFRGPLVYKTDRLSPSDKSIDSEHTRQLEDDLNSRYGNCKEFLTVMLKKCLEDHFINNFDTNMMVPWNISLNIKGERDDGTTLESYTFSDKCTVFGLFLDTVSFVGVGSNTTSELLFDTDTKKYIYKDPNDSQLELNFG